MQKLVKLGVFSLAVLIALPLLALGQQAAKEPLRWKFQQGEKLNYRMVQDMKISAEGGPIGNVDSTMHQEMQMTWNIEEVTPEGDAKIRQTFDRVTMKMAMPQGNFEYDSSSDEAPAGLAAMIAPMYKALLDGEFLVTMSPRGEVKDVEIPEEVVTALKNSPGAAAMGDLASAEGFKKMISQGSLLLPEEAPQPGDTWTNSVEMKNPMAGKQIVETTYTFEEIKEVDGTKVAVIRPELKMDFAGGEQAGQMQMKIGDQSSSGEILFNVDEGRLDTSKLNQKVTLDLTIGGQSMKQKIDQDIEVKVTSAADNAEADSTEKSTAVPE